MQVIPATLHTAKHPPSRIAPTTCVSRRHGIHGGENGAVIMVVRHRPPTTPAVSWGATDRVPEARLVEDLGDPLRLVLL